MDNDMRKMQQDAIHRVQEMQSRAKKHLQEEPQKNAEAEIPAPQQENFSAPPAALLDSLMKDSERTLILMLILLLFTEQADSAAIFSLLYLIL